MEVDYENELYNHMTSFGFEIRIQDMIVGGSISFLILLLFFLSFMRLMLNSMPKKNSTLKVSPIAEIRKFVN